MLHCETDPCYYSIPILLLLLLPPQVRRHAPVLLLVAVSDDPAWLEAFAGAALDHRLLNWGVRTLGRGVEVKLSNLLKLTKYDQRLHTRRQ